MVIRLSTEKQWNTCTSLAIFSNSASRVAISERSLVTSACIPLRLSFSSPATKTIALRQLMLIKHTHLSEDPEPHSTCDIAAAQAPSPSFDPACH
jgi:hypothetical protein